MKNGVKKTVNWQEEWVELNNSRVHKNKDSPDIMRWQGVRLITISPIRLNKNLLNRLLGYLKNKGNGLVLNSLE